jgi:tRNA-dihydrouridine synthase
MSKVTFADVHAIIEKLNMVGGSPIEAVAQRPYLIRQLQHYAEHPEECEAGVPEYIRELFRR